MARDFSIVNINLTGLYALHYCVEHIKDQWLDNDCEVAHSVVKTDNGAPFKRTFRINTLRILAEELKQEISKQEIRKTLYE